MNRLLYMAFIALLCACGTAGGAPAGGADATASDVACPADTQQPDGACCPSGQTVVQGQCVQVGPPECGADIAKDPAACQPRWCADWRDVEGLACDADQIGCIPFGRSCTAQELADGLGCLAGWWPNAQGQCRPAGLLGTTASTPTAQLTQELAAPQGVPALEPVPAIADTVFCAGETPGTSAICTGATSPCPPGQMVDPDAPSACLSVGVPWACPTGFVPTGAADADTGLPACVADPADCGDDPFGGVADGPSARFVDAKATPGGNGTRAQPFATIAEALSAVPEGGTVAVAAGTYAESPALDKAVSLRGRCAALVKLKALPTKAAMRVFGAGTGQTEVSGLHLTSGGQGLQASSTRKTIADRLWISDIGGPGVLASGTDVQVRFANGYVTNSRKGPGGPGYGLFTQYGARLEIAQTRVHHWEQSGVTAMHLGTQLVIDGLLLDGSPAEPNAGGGVTVQTGAQLQLRSARITYAAIGGVRVTDASSHATLTGLVVDHGQVSSDEQLLGVGVQVYKGGSAKLRGARLSANHTCGVLISEPKSVLDASGVLIDGSQPLANGERGSGILVTTGAQVRVDSVRITGCTDAGVLATDGGSFLRLSRALVDANLPNVKTGQNGAGIMVGSGARMELDGVRATANHMVGVGIIEAGTVAHLRNVLIDHTKSTPTGQKGGVGSYITWGATATLVGCRMTGNTGTSLHLEGDGVRAEVAGTLVDSSLPAAANQRFGTGIQVKGPATAGLHGVRLAGNRRAGLVALRKHTEVRAVGALIEDTLPDASLNAMGLGAVAFDQVTTFALTACLLRNNRSVGVQATAADLKLDGTVIYRTLGGPAVELNTSGQPVVVNQVELGDAVVISKGAKLTMSNSLLYDNVRAGLVLQDAAKVSLSNTLISKSYYGFVSLGKVIATEIAMAILNNVQNRAVPDGLYVPAPPDAVEVDVGGP